MNKVQKNVAVLFAILLGIVIIVVTGSLYAQKYAHPAYTAELSELSFSGKESLILIDYHPGMPELSTLVDGTGEVLLEADRITAEYNYQDELYVLADDYEDTGYNNEYGRQVYRVIGHDLQEIQLPEEYKSHAIELSTSADEQHYLLSGQGIRDLYLQSHGSDWRLLDTQVIPEEYASGSYDIQTVIYWSETDDSLLYIEIGTPHGVDSIAYEYNVKTNEWKQIERTSAERQYNKDLRGYYTYYPQIVCASKWRGLDYAVLNGDYRYSQCIGTYYDAWETQVTTPVVGKQKVKINQVDGEKETVLSWFSFLANRMGSAQLLDADANHILVSVDGEVGIYERATGKYAHLVSIEASWSRWAFDAQVLSTPVQ